MPDPVPDAVRVRVPASSANLGPGFDTLGMALPMFLTVELGWDENGKYYPPSNTDLIGNIIKQVTVEAGCHRPYHYSVNSQIPIARGLGSSAAAIIGALAAVNDLAQLGWTERMLLLRAAAFEGHADNVVPALIGGITTAMVTEDGIYYQKLTIPDYLQILAVVPEQELKTKGARTILPEHLSLADAVYNLQRACYLTAAFANSSRAGLKEAIQDCWHQPYREALVPGFKELQEGLKQDARVLGVTLSGSGPSVLVWFDDDPEGLHKLVEKILNASQWQGQIFHWRPWMEGATIERRYNGIWEP